MEILPDGKPVLITMDARLPNGHQRYPALNVPPGGHVEPEAYFQQKNQWLADNKAAQKMADAGPQPSTMGNVQLGGPETADPSRMRQVMGVQPSVLEQLFGPAPSPMQFNRNRGVSAGQY